MTAKPVEISVVVPCWNVEPYLARCLESVFVALPSNAEVIAVDDGSTDGTLAILESSARSEQRLKADRAIGSVQHVAPPTWLVSNFLVRPASS